MIKGMGSANYGQIWLDIETNPSSGCSWSGYSAASNCAYVTELVNAVRTAGRSVGIYSSYYMWEDIMGSAQACTTHGVNGVPIWYAHYDGNPSFGDFKTFGGFKKPGMKQFKGDTTLCGVDVDISFY